MIYIVETKVLINIKLLIFINKTTKIKDKLIYNLKLKIVNSKLLKNFGE